MATYSAADVGRLVDATGVRCSDACKEAVGAVMEAPPGYFLPHPNARAVVVTSGTEGLPLTLAVGDLLVCAHDGMVRKATAEELGGTQLEVVGRAREAYNGTDATALLHVVLWL